MEKLPILLMPEKTGYILLKFSDLAYAKAEGAYVRIRTAGGESALLTGKLKQLESILYGAAFFRLKLHFHKLLTKRLIGILVFSLVGSTIVTHAQNPLDPPVWIDTEAQIKRETNTSFLLNFARLDSIRYYAEKERAIQRARLTNSPIRGRAGTMVGRPSGSSHRAARRGARRLLGWVGKPGAGDAKGRGGEVRILYKIFWILRFSSRIIQ
ncbi:MAG: LytTR family transcriptional regulator [Saprospiraceae bacterium]|nr:LytTR family transcriptional regulator [Saprospiraceae bacterium]